MRLFPFRRPWLGLSIGATTLGFADVRRGWRTPSLRRCGERELPSGLIRPSATEANVTDVPLLARELSALFDGKQPVTRPVSVALSLPDLCARVALFEFDALPSKPSEVEGLIRFRFQKGLNVPLTDARLTYQTFHPPSIRESKGGPIRVLVAAIRGHVIEQYEQACELAGLVPVSVGLTSLQVFDRCRPVLEAALKTTGECFYLYVGEGSFVFLAVQAGVPVFLRNKPLRNGSAVAHESIVKDELLGTLQYYMEQEAIAGRVPAMARPLFVVNGLGMAPTLPDALGVTVVPIGWQDLRMARRPAAMPPVAGLPALAGVMGA